MNMGMRGMPNMGMRGMPNMGMGGMGMGGMGMGGMGMGGMGMGGMGMGMGGQGFLSTAGENLGGAVKRGIAKLFDLATQLHKNGLFMYIVLIVVGIAIYYVLRYFIGLKLGREQAERKIKKQAQNN